MKKSLILALLVALPIEALNARPSFAIDVGLPDNASRLQQFLAWQWVILHMPGLRLSNLDLFSHFEFVVVILSGYLDTAILIFAGIWLYRGVRRLSPSGRARRTSPRQ